jgi:hypothetical protein
MVSLIHTLKCQPCTVLLSCGDHWPVCGGGRKIEWWEKASRRVPVAEGDIVAAGIWI